MRPILRSENTMAALIDAPRVAQAPFYSVGQRFLAGDHQTLHGSHEVTVARVVRDALGMVHVVLVDADGREISTFAEQFELAVECGIVTPAGDWL